MEITPSDLEKAVLDAVGYVLPEGSIGILVIVLVVAASIRLTGFDNLLLMLFRGVRDVLRRYSYNQDVKDFIRSRNSFVKHLIYKVERLNQEADWNEIHYTDLEAEVEVDPAPDLLGVNSYRLLEWIHTLWLSAKNIFISPSGHIEKNLVNAIIRSKSRAFLIIGDPGSGKTVSLRHLFLKIAENTTKSKNESSQIPLYLNLKQLDIPLEEICASAIEQWMIEQLLAGQDRTIHRFVDENFVKILHSGDFFFIFDSFDEIPAIMDAYEEEDVVYRYAKALDDFLHGPHNSRGLVSSRPYRAPKVFIGQRMTISPLSYRQVRKALNNYLVGKRQLAERIWHELIREREDLLNVLRTPFYLSLLVNFVETRQMLPDRHYELYEEFVANRADTDEERLRSFVLTPDDLLMQASILAYSMTKTPSIGLEADLSQIEMILEDWETEQVQFLVNALTYSKLGKLEGSGNSQLFSFVHRRFHEYFSARFLRENIEVAPFDELVADNRWREVLVLLCEVLPVKQLHQILEISKNTLAISIIANSGSVEHRRAIETLRFLRDGFRSRLADLPVEVRTLATMFIKKQFGMEIIPSRLREHFLETQDKKAFLIDMIHTLGQEQDVSLFKEKMEDLSNHIQDLVAEAIVQAFFYTGTTNLLLNVR